MFPLCRKRSSSEAQVSDVDAIADFKELDIEDMSDTYIGPDTMKVALQVAGTACRAVDIVMTSSATNVFTCTRPPGHHAGRYGRTEGCLSTGFCLLNNAAIALVYARVRWGLERVAVVDIDVHFGNGTAEILANDPKAFFASVHMIYGEKNKGMNSKSISDASYTNGFYPEKLGVTEIRDNYVVVGVLPALIRKRGRRRKRHNFGEQVVAGNGNGNDNDDSGDEHRGTANNASTGNNSFVDVANNCEMNDKEMEQEEDHGLAASSALDENNLQLQGPEGYRRAIEQIIVPRLEAFNPELLIISGNRNSYSSLHFP
jgi:hypothetical protein